MSRRKTEQRLKAIEFHKQGFSRRQIAERVGVSPDIIKTRIAMYKFDNAAAENFFSHLKSELINRVKLKDYEEAKELLTTIYDITTTREYR